MYNELFNIYGVEPTEDVSLIEKALTHPSYIQQNNMTFIDSYERLEFLGDSLLKLVSSEILYKKFPDYTEGKLSKIRSFLIADATLAEISFELGLNKFLRLGDGEEKCGGRKRTSNNACMFEALLGAFYLLGKENEIKTFLNNVLSTKISTIIDNIEQYNAKEILQEYTQSIDKKIPQYEVVKTSGPAHAQIFEVDVIYNEKILAHGKGTTKKAAQINAAYLACKSLGIIK